MQAPIATANIPHRLINVNEFYRMAEAGILAEDERVELIEGELSAMSPIGSFHAGLHTRLSRVLAAATGSDTIVYTQNPVYLSEISSPEPDISLLKARADDYMRSLPQADDVLLLIEISDTSENYDLNTKLPLYAHYQIPEAWLINVKKKTLEIYLKPSADGYRLNLRPEAGEIIVPSLVASIQLDWWALFDGI